MRVRVSLSNSERRQPARCLVCCPRDPHDNGPRYQETILPPLPSSQSREGEGYCHAPASQSKRRAASGSPRAPAHGPAAQLGLALSPGTRAGPFPAGRLLEKKLVKEKMTQTLRAVWHRASTPPLPSIASAPGNQRPKGSAGSPVWSREGRVRAGPSGPGSPGPSERRGARAGPPAPAYLQHGHSAAGTVHLEGGRLVPRGGGGGLGLVVAEAGGGDVDVPERQRLLRPLEVVEVAAARVEDEPAAAEAAQRALPGQLLQVAAELGGSGPGLLPRRALVPLRARRRHRLSPPPPRRERPGPRRAASRDL